MKADRRVKSAANNPNDITGIVDDSLLSSHDISAMEESHESMIDDDVRELKRHERLNK